MRVLVFGDSIAYGAWDTEGGWVDRLKRDAHRETVAAGGETKVQIINLGVGGDTSTKIRGRIEQEIVARHSASWPFVFVIALGTNDQRQIDGRPETPLADFQQNVAEIIKIAQKYTGKILFVGAPPLGKDVVMFKGQEYSDERIAEYEAQAKQQVLAADLVYVDLREPFLSAGHHLYAYDFIHPDDAGHELIAKTVKPQLWQLLK